MTESPLTMTEVQRTSDVMFQPEMLERVAKVAWGYLRGTAVPWEEVTDENKAIWRVCMAIALNEYHMWLREILYVPVPDTATKVSAEAVRTEVLGKKEHLN